MGDSLRWRLYTGGHLGRILLSQLPVTAITCAQDGSIWVALDHIITIYRQGRWAYSFTCPPQLNNGYPIEFICWWQNALWIGNHGLWRFQDDRLELIAVLPEDRVLALSCTNTKQLIVAFEQAGIWYTEEQQQWVSVDFPDGYERLLAYTSDMLGNLWGLFQGKRRDMTQSQSLHYLTTVYSNRTWTTDQQWLYSYSMRHAVWTKHSPIPKPSRVMNISIDSSSAIWISTEGDGIWQYKNTTWQHMVPHARQRAVRDLPSKYVIGLYSDHYARTWSVHLRNIELGVYESGVWYTVFIAPKDTAIPEKEPTIWIPEHTNASFYDMEHERIWIGTGGGEVGWINVTPNNQLVPPSTTTNYEAQLIEMHVL